MQQAYDPVALNWSAAEVERAGAVNLRAVIRRATSDGELGCALPCERVQGIFERLVEVARWQTPRAGSLRWSLQVVRTPGVEAMALPDGSLVISEAFIASSAADDPSLAFVLAHEMAHAILEHERQTLHVARMLLPAGVERNVADMYVELGHNFGLYKAIQFALQQYELEADELGLLMAAAAGFAPRRQLSFLVDEAQRPAVGQLMQSHPSGSERLDQARLRLPLAERLFDLAIRHARHQ